jgi:hypothetical protein
LAVSAVYGWSLTAASAQVGIDFRGAWIHEPLGLSEAAMVRKYPKTTTAFVMKSADEHIFDDPKLFPGLRNVALEVGCRNVANLKALSTNYAQLRCLTIRQSEPLSDEAVSCLAKFTNLALRCLVRFKKLSALKLAGSSLPIGEYAFVSSLPLRIVNSDNAR